MTQYRAIVVDDEPIACRRVVRMLKEDPEINVVAVCNDGKSAVEKLTECRPQLVFLDIQMADMDGFEVLRQLPQEDVPLVVFVTAYDEYAIQAFEFSAADYLLKPIETSRFRKAVSRVKNRLKSEMHPEKINKQILEMLHEIGLPDKYLDRVAVKNGSRILFVKTNTIEWIEAQGKYLYLHCGNQSHRVRMRLTDMERKLNPKKFLRIHKSVMINLEYVKELHPWFHGDCRILLLNGKELTLSRRFRNRIQNILDSEIE